MARAFRWALGRLVHRTVPAHVVRGFGGALVAVGVALPWAVTGFGGWSPGAVSAVTSATLVPDEGRVDPNGLLGESFVIYAKATKMFELTTSTPATLFIAPNLEAGRLPGTLEAPVQLRFTGSLNITEAAEYKLCTTSSDGSKLMIEDVLVVNNDGVHKDPVETCEAVQLEPGDYKIEIQSFHVSGAIALTASWAKGKLTAPTPIPKTAFFKPEGADDKIKAAKP